MKTVDSQHQAPPETPPRRHKGFSYTEIKVFELIGNLSVAAVLMVLLVGMTFLIGWLRRDHASAPGPEHSAPLQSSPQQTRP